MITFILLMSEDLHRMSKEMKNNGGNETES